MSDYNLFVNNVLLDITLTKSADDKIRAIVMYDQQQIGEFDFIKISSEVYAGEDAAILVKEFKRKGIYTFVIDCIQYHYNVRIVPSKLLTKQGKKFWKNRLTNSQPSRAMYVK